ncbi:Ionotropic receptor 25a, partial [Gryllus bimaculatus]
FLEINATSMDAKILLRIGVPYLLSMLYLVQGIPPKLLSALKNHFHASCLFILSSSDDLRNVEKLLKLQRHLFDEGIETAIMNISVATTHGNSIFCRHGRLLYVVDSLSETLTHLQRVKTSLPLTVPRWLLFLGQRSEEVTAQLAEGLKAPFDSEFLLAEVENNGSVSLTEVYRVNSSLPLLSSRWGLWGEQTGLTVTGTGHVHSRRADLFGTTIRVAAGHDPPYDYLIKHTDGKRLNMEGYSSEVWKQLEMRLNFTTELYEAKENEWGSIQEDGTWSGMIGMILNNKVDAGVNSFLVTPARASVIDFITPLVTSKAGVFIRIPGILDSRWGVFITSFDFALWITLVRHWATPNEWSCRIVFWTAYFIAVIAAAAYSANFMACLAIRKVSLPFTSLEGLLRDGSYDFGVLAESGLLTIFQNSTDEIMRKIYTKFIKPKLDSLPKEYVQGFEKVCHKSRYAHMENYDTYLMYASSLPCEILTLPEASFQQHMGLIVSKTLPYRKLFKHTSILSSCVGIIRILI